MPIPKPDTQEMKNTWAIQLYTGKLFSKNILNWYGWIKFQIEHHIFPHISHVHYRKIASIIKSTAKEFNLPTMSLKLHEARYFRILNF